jgi:ATP-dependent DNA ligase
MPPRKSTHRSPARFLARVLPGAVVAPFPEATALPRTKGTDKRVQLHLELGRPKLYDAAGEDCTDQFPAIARAARELPANNLVLVGTIEAGAAAFTASDLDYLDGFDLRGTLAAARKRVLAAFIADAPPAFAVKPSSPSRRRPE